MVVVNGVSTAVQEALYLSNLASKVTVVHCRHRFQAVSILRYRLLAKPKIKSFGTASSPKFSENRAGYIKVGSWSTMTTVTGSSQLTMFSTRCSVSR
ncbi:hypothetical protein SAMN05216228_107715 [Rhizobium tibeticum]|uniref:Thioredoxin reductase n=1 Tax=Rhizobium tibeticum TaxID=501024 RepID=A0A1H8WTA2_9HYPH|nr:Thioredoxin reductase [Rhizobium tibeticum]SEP30861.1 hypothetical protein SAMN05216228_107715 [Rhizobium tibeticum]